MTTRSSGARPTAIVFHSTGPVALHLRQLCSGALLIAAAAHIVVGTEHPGSNFGTLAVAAGIAQGVLAVVLFISPSTAAIQVTLVSSLMLLQLYFVNVTVGLPPLIAHSHIGGTHVVVGLTLGWPGIVDAQGILAKCAEAISAITGVRLLREI